MKYISSAHFEDLLKEIQSGVIYELWSNWVDDFGSNICDKYGCFFACLSDAESMKYILLESVTARQQHIAVACCVRRSDE